MGPRREIRGPRRRTDAELLANEDVMFLLGAISRGHVTRQSTRANAPFLLGDTQVQLRWLAHEDLVFAPFGGTATPTLLTRKS